MPKFVVLLRPSFSRSDWLTCLLTNWKVKLERHPAPDVVWRYVFSDILCNKTCVIRNQQCSRVTRYASDVMQIIWKPFSTYCEIF